ncbi:MAG: hypothetical protein AAFX94_23495, partial [Myxococcota bacterium]
MMHAVMGRVGAAFLFLTWGCATTVGDISSIERLPSNLPEPSRPEEPSRPDAFPDVLLVWARAAGSVEAQPDADIALAQVEDDPLPTPENLPPPPAIEETGEKAEEFNTAANRAVSRVEIDDYDDTAILLSLQEQLQTEPQLQPLKDTWETRIEAAVQRAESLRRIRVVVANLKQAFATAELNP